MIRIQRAQEKDFEEVYPLLQRYFAQVRFPREQWQRLFKRSWQVADDSYGLLLLDGEKVCGFLGTIFSERCFEGRIHRLCNMTSWVVADDYRVHSLRLLLELLKLPDCTLTNFTPSHGVAALLERTGFKEFSADRLILWPVSWSLGRNYPVQLIDDPVFIRQTLDTGERRIFDDHQGLPCSHLLLCDGQSYCYLVTTRSRCRRLPVAKVHYLSNPEQFYRWHTRLRLLICLHLRVVGIMVEQRSVQSLSFATSVPAEARTFYRSGSLQPRQIDTLYSEMIVLHASENR